MMNRMTVAIGMGLLGMAAYFMVGDNQKEMRDRIDEIESGVPRWKESEFAENIEEMKSYLEEAMAALARHDQAASFRKYHRVVAHWKHYPSFHPQKEIEPGVAVEDWYEELQETYREAMRGEFDLIVAGLESGELDSLWLRDFGHDCEQVGLDDMAERLEAEKDRIGRIRTVAAAKWFRVTFSSVYPDYEQEVRAALTEKWNDRYGYRLVFGNPIDKNERRVTWKTLEFRIEQDEARYYLEESNALKHLAVHVAPPVIPYAVRIETKLKGNERVTTSWDQIEDIKAEAEIPDTIRILIEKGKGLADGEESKLKGRESNNREILIAAVREKVQALPEFKLFPGVDPSSLSLRKGDEIDMEAARALAFLDPIKLMREVTGLLRTEDVELQKDLMLLAIDMDLDPLAPWVGETLLTMRSHDQEPIVNALKRKPWYGGYGPLLSMIDNPDKSASGWALDALRGQLHEGKLTAALIKKIDDPSCYQRSNYANFLISEAPLDLVKERAPGWLKDNDEEFAAHLFNTVARRDQEFAETLIFDFYNDVTQRVQSRMLGTLKFRHKQDPQQALTLLRGIVTRTADEELRRQALEVLKDGAGQTAVWDTLKELAGFETYPERKRELHSRLIHSVQRTHPDNARAFYLEYVGGPDPRLRLQAFGIMCAGNDPKGELMGILAGVMRENPEDDDFVREVIRDIHHYYRIREGWEFGQGAADYETIFSRAARHPDAKVREMNYKVLKHVIEQGFESYDKLLKESLGNESDDQLRQKFVALR